MANDDSVLEPLLSLRETQRILNLSAVQVYRFLGRGELPSVKIGHRRMVEPAALREFIAARRESRLLNDDDRAGTRSRVRISAGGGGGDEPG